MTGEMRPGRYRLTRPKADGSWLILFFQIWFSNSRGGFVVADVKRVEGEYIDRVAKEDARPLTPALWSKLVFWQ